jgi:hypothetical protein
VYLNYWQNIIQHVRAVECIQTHMKDTLRMEHVAEMCLEWNKNVVSVDDH